MHAVIGFAVRLTGRDHRHSRLADHQTTSLEGVSTALIFPIYNEDSARVCAGLRATFESLRQTGQMSVRFFHSERLDRPRQMD